jgi:alkylation response protein AidB-like acyl-CoA dehydrogenase
VNLLPSPEQAELTAAAARFLAAAAPVNDAGALWGEMASLGWLAIGVSAELGGAGGSAADQALLFRELGRALAPGPLLGTALGVAVAIAGGHAELAQSLMNGGTTAALAEPWRDGSAGVAGGEAGAAGGGARVSGRFRLLDVDTAGWVTVLTPNGLAIVGAEQVRDRAHSLPAPDATVPVALAQLDGVDAELAVTGEVDRSAVVARGRILAAALLVGILEAVRDLSVAYVLQREQFGKPIGSFQAVKHRCADMAVRAEAAGSLLWLAALSLDAGAPDAARLAASVKALASEYAVVSAHDNVQNHGGMGFTAECSAHLYVKRALEWSVTLGTPDLLLAEVAR